jgi:hypothetical protein
MSPPGFGADPTCALIVRPDSGLMLQGETLPVRSAERHTCVKGASLEKGTEAGKD